MQETQWRGFDPWVEKIPWRMKRQLTPVFLPKKPHGQKILVGHIPEGHKESNVTEHTQHSTIIQAYKPLLTQWHMVTHQTCAFQKANPSPQAFTRALLAPLELSGLVIRFCLDSTFLLYLDLLTNILAMF